MINRKKQYGKQRNVKIDFFIAIVFLMLASVSIILKNNIVLIIEAMLIGCIFIWYIYISDSRLLIFTVLGILLAPTFSLISGTLNNLPYFVFVLLCIKLVEKIVLKQKIKFNKTIVFLSTALFIINILSLIYNHNDIDILILVYYSLRKYSFLILYLFFVNADITKKDIKNSLNIIIVFGIFQFVIVAIKFALGVRQDNLSGMFGENTTGVMIQFLTIMLILIIAFKDKFSKIPFLDLIVMFFSLIYSAMGEVKIGFLIIPFIYFFTLLAKGKKVKIIISTIILLFSFSIIYSSFIKLYPEQDVLSNLTTSKEYLNNAYGSEKVNRVGFFPLLKSTVLDTTEKQLFGTGLASLNPSMSDNLQGPLMKKYSYLNIQFFALPYSITESGLVGTSIWLMIYIYIFIINVKKYRFDKSNKSIVNIMLVIDTFIFIFYNNSLFMSFHIILFIWFIISYFNDEEIKGVFM